MRNRTIMVLFALLGVVCWAGLAYFMNQYYPTPTRQYLFLVIGAAAMLFSVAPVSYAIHDRGGWTLGRGGDVARSLRQGLLAAIVAALMMFLHFMRMLGPGTAVVLVLIAVLIEVAFYIIDR